MHWLAKLPSWTLQQVQCVCPVCSIVLHCIALHCVVLCCVCCIALCLLCCIVSVVVHCVCCSALCVYCVCIVCALCVHCVCFPLELPYRPMCSKYVQYGGVLGVCTHIYGVRAHIFAVCARAHMVGNSLLWHNFGGSHVHTCCSGVYIYATP